MSPDIRNVNKSNIQCFKQNKIGYILRDCERFGIDTHLIRLILLARGVNKWLANRIEFIKLKSLMREEITKVQKEMLEAKKGGHYYHVAKLKGYLKAKEEDRVRLRKICHSDRWQWPD